MIEARMAHVIHAAKPGCAVVKLITLDELPNAGIVVRYVTPIAAALMVAHVFRCRLGYRTLVDQETQDYWRSRQ